MEQAAAACPATGARPGLEQGIDSENPACPGIP